jgi:hypothetical protein
MSGVGDYSTTPASNTTINSIGIQGTNSPANFDNAFRQLMADIATARTDGALASMPYATKSSGYTLLTTDRGKLIDCTAALEIELLAVATAGAGFYFIAKGNGGAVTLDPNGSENINGSSTSATVANGSSAFVLCDGTAWFTVTMSSATGDVTTTGTQTLTNKSLSDSTTFFIDNSDATKKLQFQISSITTGTTRTVTWPDTDGTVWTTGQDATAAQYRANTADKLLTTDIVWSSAEEVTLTDAATIAVDMNTFINAVVTLGGNRALGSPTNEKVGQTGYIRIVQDGTGSRTLSYGTDWEFAGGTAPVLTTTASAQDLLFYTVLASNRIFGSLVKAIA